MADGRYQPFPVVKPPELCGKSTGTYPVAIIGAGPIGLAAAVDLAQHGVRSVVLDDNNVVSVGSRAICWAKRTLEIFDRLGIGERMVAKGVTWKTGRLFHGHDEVFRFDLLPEDGYKMPAFINLQQYYVEQYLIERAREFPELIDLRFENTVTDHAIGEDQVTLSVATPDGDYTLNANYALACDGARSPTRERMNLAFQGQRFEERFLIADVKMTTPPFDNDGTPERWFWFKPPFHQGQSALLHKQPDDIYRIDLQLGPDTDPEEEKRPDKVIARIKAMVGDKPFELDWVSVYRFTCARLDRFVHGRLIFVGDSAHVVSPFGARGGNGGIHDIDNLCWKLAAVLRGQAPSALIESYAEERQYGSDENIGHSARATRFMSPEGEMATLFRDEVLNLASTAPFARALINSGRLSTPCSLAGMSLQSSAADTLAGSGAEESSAGGIGNRPQPASAPGLSAPDAPLPADGWLLNKLGGRFVVLAVGCEPPVLDTPVDYVQLECNDVVGARYAPGVYLIRPDQHIAAYWPEDSANTTAVHSAYRRALAQPQPAQASPNRVSQRAAETH